MKINKSFSKLLTAILVAVFALSVTFGLVYTVPVWAEMQAAATAEEDGTLLHSDSSLSNSVLADGNKLRIGEKNYTDLKTALDDANSGTDKKVYVVNSFSISGSVDIPAGVELIIPFDDQGTYNQNGSAQTSAAQIAWHNSTYQEPVYTLTIEDGATVNVHGKLILGAVTNNPGQPYSGATTGAYSKLINNGNINVLSDGIFDIYGLVTGSGSITVHSGGKLLQPFVVGDFAGGTITMYLYYAKQSPFGRYSMINVQCKGGITVEYKGEVYAHAQLYAGSQYNNTDVAVISYSEESDAPKAEPRGLITLTEPNSFAKAVYTEPDESTLKSVIIDSQNSTQYIGKTELILSGGASFNYMSLTIKVNAFMEIPVSTKDVFAFPVPYNFDIKLEKGKGSGNFSTKCNFKLMPGSKLTVGEGATLDLNNNFYVYDGLIQDGTMANKRYPTATELSNANYSTNGNLIVNGTLNIHSGKTFLGAVQTTGNTGTINVEEGAVLSGSVADGHNSYAYAKFTLKTQLYDKAHDEIVVPVAGNIFHAVAGDEWTLPSVEMEGKSGSIGSTENVLMHGSWMVEHSEHKGDWTPQLQDNKPNDSTKRTTIERECQEFGCTAKVQKELLFVPDSLGDIVYNGKDVTAEQLQTLVDELFGTGIQASFSEFTAHDVKDNCPVTIQFFNALWLDGESYSESKQLTFNVKPAALTLTPTAQSSVYSGKEVTPDPGMYTAQGLCDGDKLTLTIKGKDGEVIKDVGIYTLVIEINQGEYPNYTINLQEGTYTVDALAVTVVLKPVTRDYNGAIPQASDVGVEFKQGFASVDDVTAKELVTVTIEQAAAKAATYTVSGTQKEGVTNYEVTVEGGTTYTINKKKVTVTADAQTSVYGKSLNQLTYKVEGLVGNDNIDDFIAISTDANKDSGTGTYTITVAYKSQARPDNYDVDFVNGSYSITDAAFEGITFENDSVVYDGETHDLKVKGAPEGAEVSYTLEGGKAFTGAKDQGIYKVTATVKLANYKELQLTATLTVSKRDITVTVEGLTRAYNGKVPQASELTATLVECVLGTGDDIESLVAISLTDASANVGKYAITATATEAAGNYNITFGELGSYQITAAEVTVELQPQSKVYDGAEGVLAQGKWTKTSGEWADGKIPVITLELADSSMYVNVGSYNIKGSCADSNYNITFEKGQGAYTITKRALTVTADNQQTVYGDALAQLTYKVEGHVEDGTTVQVIISCDATRLSPVNANGYVITVTVANASALSNYDVSTSNGTYTLVKRALTVTVNDQNAVYDPEGNYAFDVNGWRITEGRLASGESNSVLNVVLTKPEITNAGSYEITAAYTNSNYEVTIVKGNYNVSKLNLPDNDQTVFELYIDGDYFDPDKIYTYSGTALELTAHVYYLLSPETEIGVKVDPSSIAEAGYITVTVTVDDPNYSGERTYTVTVVGEDGLTPRLKEVLESLEALCGDLTIDTLSSTEENFTKLKQAQSLIDSLTEEEKESGAETLAPYTELLQAWNRASELDEGVISTAKAIADAPLKGLLAAVNALLAAVYAALKGGIRK